MNSYSTSDLLTSFNQEMAKIDTIRSENSVLSSQLKELESQELAALSEPKSYISGEPLDTTIKGYFATINAHNYYSEEFLNLFLPKQLKYQDNAIYYDREAPERINVIGANLTYDVIGFDLYNGSSHFTMGRQDYGNGMRPSDSYNHLMNIACNGNYSQIEFTLGHVDNTRRDSRELIIYYMDNEGEFKEAATFSLYADMPIQTHSVPIYKRRKPGNGPHKRGLNSKIHLAVDAHGMPVRFFVTSGTTADCAITAQLIEGFQAEYLLADRGYDTDAITRLFNWVMRTFHMSFMLHVEFCL